MPFNDLREFIDAARQLGQVKEIHGAHWNLEIGALTEMFAFKEPSPLVIFDQIPDHGTNFRVAANLINTPARSGLTVGMPADAAPIELVARWKELLKGVKPIPPRVVNSGPILENVKTGTDIDMSVFPTPHWHELDGGRYIGTADCVITGEPEEGGWVNVGIYRVQVHDKNTLGLYVSPGHHARIMREKYWEKGKACPVVVTFGQDPLLFLVAGQSIAYGMSELDYCGGLRGAPVDVIRGDVTGLPIPATAEIAIEGEVPPPQEQVHVEGPFGEWPGYYAHGAANEPVIRVKKLYYRNNPILCGAPPLKPPFITFGVPIGAAAIWNYLEKADVPDIKGVWCYVGGSAAAGGAPFHRGVVEATLSRPFATSRYRRFGLTRRQLSWPLCDRRRRRHRSIRHERSHLGGLDPLRSQDGDQHYRRLLEHAARSGNAPGPARCRQFRQ